VSTTRRAPTRRALIAGDLLCLTLFAVLGLVSHDDGVTISGLLRTAVPIAGGWLIAASLFGTYRRPGLVTLLPAWAVGVTLGVVVRALLLGRDFDGATGAFLGVALGVTLALLLAWRALALVFARRPVAG
jgi:hypothetical protein